MTDIRTIDLFCGAGGFSSGFKRNNMEVLLGIDNNITAMKTFAHNHHNAHAVTKDVSKVTAEYIAKEVGSDIDVVIGGPPCQGFSMAGKREPNDPRNLLVFEYLRLIGELNPKVFIMENVRGIRSMKNGNGLVIEKIYEKIRNLGYEFTSDVLHAEDYGVPQKRHRFILMGHKKDINISIPEKTHFENGLNPDTEKKMSRWTPVSKCVDKKSNANEKLFYSEKLIRGFRRREKNNKKRHLGFKWQFLKMNKPSHTISARYYKDGAEALVKYSEDEIRMLSDRECARVQSFQENFVFEGSRVEKYRQVGNAVPSLLGKIMAEEVKKSLK